MLYAYRRGRLQRMIMVALGIIVLIWLTLFGCVAVTATRMDAPQAADTMIVLGGAVDEQGRPKSTLQYRLERACELYAQGYSHNIIVCGGQGSDEPITEARAMYAYLIDQGIPAPSIMLEDASTDTVENLNNAREIMAAHSLHTAIVVTSDYHLWRALRIAEDAGIDASGAGAQNSRSRSARVKNIMRETFSWVKYALKA